MAEKTEMRMIDVSCEPGEPPKLYASEPTLLIYISPDPVPWMLLNHRKLFA